MKIFDSPKAAFAVLLAAILLCTVIYTPSSKADITTHEVKLLMVYDTSYEAYMQSYSINNPAERIRQMVMLAAIPFGLQWDVDFDVTVQAYANVLGTDPALSCVTMHPYVNGQAGRERYWLYNVGCSCPEITGHDQHHSNAHNFIQIARGYINNQVTQDPYDNCGIITGHKLCSGSDDDHSFVYGKGRWGSYGFVLRGILETNSDTTDSYQFFNWLYTKSLFSHELSHNFRTHDWYSSTHPCTEDSPCIMNTGFEGVVYVRNIWCDNCHQDFTPGQFD